MALTEKELLKVLERSKRESIEEHRNRFRSPINDDFAKEQNQEYSKWKELSIDDRLKQARKEKREIDSRLGGLLATETNENDKDEYQKNPVNFSHMIPSNAKVIVTRMKHLIEIQHMKTMNFKQTIQMLPRNEDTGFREYEVISSGEVFTMNESANRSESQNSLKKTFKKLRYLINNNFTGEGNELHIILTYGKHVTDRLELMKDFENFMKRLRYNRKKVNQKLEYINVVEPQASGRWHCHVLLSFTELQGESYVMPEKPVYIPNAVIEKLWSHGFTKTKKIQNVDNIGAYLSAYLADIDVTGEDITGDKVVTKMVDGVEKKFIKGGRLHFYDSGVNLYRKSSGIKEPERETMKYKDIKKEVGLRPPHFSSKIFIEQEQYKNEITYLQYNQKR